MIFSLFVLQVLNTFAHSQDNGLKLRYLVHDSTRMLIINRTKLLAPGRWSSLTCTWYYLKTLLICNRGLATSLFHNHVLVIFRFLARFCALDVAIGLCICLAIGYPRSQAQVLIALQSLKLDIRFKIFSVFAISRRSCSWGSTSFCFLGCVWDLSNFFTEIEIFLQIGCIKLGLAC